MAFLRTIPAPFALVAWKHVWPLQEVMCIDSDPVFQSPCA